MNLLVLDGGGPVGAAVLNLCDQSDDLECVAAEPDLLQPPFAELSALVESFQPDFLINAFTLSTAERQGLDEAHLSYVQFLGEFCASKNLGLLHLSSAQVFSPRRGQPYRETEEAVPNTEVGRQYLAVEQALAQTTAHLLALRCSWVFGLQGEGAFHRFLRHLEQGGDLPLYLEEEGAPTAATDLARVLLAIVRQLHWGADCWGLYHYCSSDVASSREFAETVMTLAGQHGDVDVDRVNLVEEYEADTRAVPHHPLLECSRIKDCFGIKQRPWRSAITTMLKTHYHRS